MKMLVDRRDMLKATLGGMAGLALPLTAGSFPAFAASSDLAVKRLSDRIIMVTGAGANVVAAKTADGILMVDGGASAHSDALLNLVAKELGTDKFATLFNTHWHPEQTGSNVALKKKGAHIISHANTKLWLSTDITAPYETMTHQPLPKEARGDEIFYTELERDFGGLTVKSGYMLQAHTDGDIYVHFPQDNILVTGGPVSNAGWPYMDWWTGGWIAGLADGVKLLADLADDKTVVVPANGTVMTKAELNTQAAMYADLFNKLRTGLYSALSPAEAVAQEPAKDYVAAMGDPEQFLTLSFQSMWGHFAPDA
jgi:glyoxylase-like metal-dependent hydrolase (beta-lactamase superfamily II)